MAHPFGAAAPAAKLDIPEGLEGLWKALRGQATDQHMRWAHRRQEAETTYEKDDATNELPAE